MWCSPTVQSPSNPNRISGRKEREMPKYRVPSFITKEYELEHVLALPAASRRRHNMYTTCAACHKQIETEFLYAGFAQGQPNRMFHFDCLDELSQAIIEYPKCQKCGEECRE